MSVLLGEAPICHRINPRQTLRSVHFNEGRLIPSDLGEGRHYNFSMVSHYSWVRHEKSKNKLTLTQVLVYSYGRWGSATWLPSRTKAPPGTGAGAGSCPIRENLIRGSPIGAHSQVRILEISCLSLATSKDSYQRSKI